MRHQVGIAFATALAAALASAEAGAGPEVTRGQKLFTEKTCVTCHNIGAPSAGLGPELTQVGWHRDSTWLVAWLTDPPKIKKDTPMPKLPWKPDGEMQAVIAYVLSARKPIPAADSADGAKLFADFKCGACHAMAKKGGKPQFPDLGHEAKRHDAVWVERWLSNPQAMRPGTFEPRYTLTATQRKALAEYLGSLK